MVSTRFKKRVTVVLFVSILVLVCFYKMQRWGNDQLSRAAEQTKHFSSIIDRGRSTPLMNQNDDDEANDPGEGDFSNNNDTSASEAAEPPIKVHRGLEDNEEVEDTLDWLRDHGVKPPPDLSDIKEEITATDQEGSISPPTSQMRNINLPATEKISTVPHAISQIPSTTSKLLLRSTRPKTIDRAANRDELANKPPDTFSMPFNSKLEFSSPVPSVSEGTTSTAPRPVSRLPSITFEILLRSTLPVTSDHVTTRDTEANKPPETSLMPYHSKPSPSENETTSNVPHPASLVPSTIPPSTTSETSPQSTQPPATKGFPYTSPTSRHSDSKTLSHPFVSEQIKSVKNGAKSTSSSMTLAESLFKAPEIHTNLSSNVSTDRNSGLTSSSALLPTTGIPTPTYTTPSLTNLHTCKLPKLNPWDPSIRHLLEDVGDDPGCRNGFPAPAFDVVANRLVLTGEVNADEVDFKQVNVETIHRNDEDDNNVHFMNQGNPFTGNLSSDDFNISNIINASDFFKLTYTMKTGKENTHYFARVVPQLDAMREARLVREGIERQGTPEGLKLNVVMLGIDSVSAASFRRKMPKSLDFLKTSLKTFFISGQTVIGDGTTPALTAMLTGLYETEAPEGRQGFDNSAPVDNWPWLMKLYKEHGYVTMMAEDDPIMGAFNLRLKGFKDPPANHYVRPFWLALEENNERDEPGLCSRSTFMTNFTLDYVLSFFTAYPDNLKFAFAFMSYLAHAHPNHLSFADNDLLRVLRTFVKHKYHENTVIVIFGDHGSRNDDVRNTMQGKLEERLPWLSISVPEWIEEKYPDITSALKQNEDIVSTPFDLHATLHHVLTYPKEPQGEKTQSLFTTLNYSRTCGEADYILVNAFSAFSVRTKVDFLDRSLGIDEHWCPCLEFRNINITSPHVIGGAEMAVKYINDVILNRTDLLRTSCVRIKLKKILKAEHFKPNEKLQRFSSTNQDSDRAVNFDSPTADSAHYRINFMTSPGNAFFEATVAVREDKKVIVNPNISRTNVYGDQPRCILRKYPYARKFCYCKETMART